MRDLGSKPREVWKQPGRLPAEGRLGSSENTSKPRRCLLFVACLALFAYAPRVWHSEPRILILILCKCAACKIEEIYDFNTCHRRQWHSTLRGWQMKQCGELSQRR
jgi:hypothetical protein